jgi:hypothetical protein
MPDSALGLAASGTLARAAALSAVAASGEVPHPPRPGRARHRVGVALVLAAALLGGCASLAGSPAAPVSPRLTPAAAPAAAPPRAAAASAAPPAPQQLQAFDTLVRDARRIDAGPVTAWQRDERIWLEIAPDQFGKPFLLAPELATGIGEDFIYGGLLRSAGLVEFRRIHNVVQLILLNPRFAATPGTPEARSVAAAYSPSLVGSAAVASQPHPQRHSVLIDAGQIFLGDILGLGMQLQRTYRQGYTLDPRNTMFTGVRGSGATLLLQVSAHYATGSIVAAPPGAPPGTPVPSVPDNLPDARNLFLGVNYALMRLPEQPMTPRRADPRIGYFTTVVDRYDTDDLARTPRQRYVQRWRLEKKDPAAAMSPPVRPITFWLDRTIPPPYREPIRAGILEWNRAFERLGFEGAVVVREAGDDDDPAVPQPGEVVVRWLSDSEIAVSALAMPQVDPRSGEILHAGIVIEGLAIRSLRSTRSRILGAAFGADANAAGPIDPEWAQLMQLGRSDAAAPQVDAGDGPDARICLQGSFGAEQLAYGLDVLAARDDIAPDSPEAQQFVLGFLKDTAMHEAGHALGLRHNFRASRLRSDRELSDPEYTRTHALSGSVMEYLPINLPRPGAPVPAPFQTALGDYDYWAIDYGYRPLPAADEAAELEKIAARNSEPGLAFGTDEDTFLGIDPEALQFDLGDDELAFAAKRFDIVHELFKRQETRQLRPGQDYAELRRSLSFAVRDAVRATGIVVRQIGGVVTLRDYPNTGRDPLQPLPAAEQRAALDFLARHVLGADSWVVSPALQRRLAPDFLERSESLARTPTEVSVSLALLDLQRAVLNALMSDQLASRVLESEAKVDHPKQAFRLSELYRRLDAAIWGELDKGGDIPLRRRELQREHANRLAALVLRPGALTRSDARALVREEARRLLLRVQTAARRPAIDESTRLHLLDVADTLRSALAAPLQRAGV